MQHIRKNQPIYPILPSVVNVADEIRYFHDKGFAGFPDEVLFGQTFVKAWHHQKDRQERIKIQDKSISGKSVNKRPELTGKKGYLNPKRKALHC